MEMSIERSSQAASYKRQATSSDSSYELQDTSQHICKILELPSYKLQDTSDKLQATSYSFFGPTGFPVWHFQPGKIQFKNVKQFQNARCHKRTKKRRARKKNKNNLRTMLKNDKSSQTGEELMNEKTRPLWSTLSSCFLLA